VRLRPDGRLIQEPRVINSGVGPLFADAANSAVRALVQCEPYDLPRDLYEGGWDHMVVTFDPQRMF
jgi:colicin import membrane protein